MINIPKWEPFNLEIQFGCLFQPEVNCIPGVLYMLWKSKCLLITNGKSNKVVHINRVRHHHNHALSTLGHSSSWYPPQVTIMLLILFLNHLITHSITGDHLIAFILKLGTRGELNHYIYALFLGANKCTRVCNWLIARVSIIIIA